MTDKLTAAERAAQLASKLYHNGLGVEHERATDHDIGTIVAAIEQAVEDATRELRDHIQDAANRQLEAEVAMTRAEVEVERHKRRADRLIAFIDKLGKDQCLVWRGGKGKRGYGRFWDKGRLYLSHRWLYEQAKGHVPEGLQLDHTCKNKLCVNLNHLEAVTPSENTKRGPTANGSKTHCIRGHPLSGPNLYVRPGGMRQCRACRLESRVKHAKSESAGGP